MLRRNLGIITSSRAKTASITNGHLLCTSIRRQSIKSAPQQEESQSSMLQNELHRQQSASSSSQGSFSSARISLDHKQQNQNVPADTQIDTASAKLRGLNLVSELKNVLDSWQIQESSLREAIAELGSKNKDLQARCEQVTQNFDHVTKHLRVTIDERKRAAESAAKQMDSLQKELASVRASLDQVKADAKDQLARQLQDQRKSLSQEFESKISSLLEKERQIQAKLQEQLQLAQQRHEQDLLAQSVKNAQDHREELLRSQSENENKLREITQQQNVDFSAKIGALEKAHEVAIASAIAAAAAASSSSSSSSVKQLSEQNPLLQNQFDSHQQQELESLRRNLESALSLQQKLSIEKSSLEKQAQEIQQQLSTAISQLELISSEKQKAIDSYQTEIAKLKNAEKENVQVKENLKMLHEVEVSKNAELVAQLQKQAHDFAKLIQEEKQKTAAIEAKQKTEAVILQSRESQRSPQESIVVDATSFSADKIESLSMKIQQLEKQLGEEKTQHERILAQQHEQTVQDYEIKIRDLLQQKMDQQTSSETITRLQQDRDATTIQKLTQALRVAEEKSAKLREDNASLKATIANASKNTFQQVQSTPQQQIASVELDSIKAEMKRQQKSHLQQKQFLLLVFLSMMVLFFAM